MDPVTAMILLTLVSGAIGMDAANKQSAEQRRLQREQEKLRVDSVRAEVGAQQQSTQTAMTGAATRNTNRMQPSFASAALSGNQSSAAPPSNSVGSSGTF